MVTFSYNISIINSPQFVLPWKQRKTTLSLFSTRQLQGAQMAFSLTVYIGNQLILTNIQTILSQLGVVLLNVCMAESTTLSPSVIIHCTLRIFVSIRITGHRLSIIFLLSLPPSPAYELNNYIAKTTTLLVLVFCYICCCFYLCLCNVMNDVFSRQKIFVPMLNVSSCHL